METIVLNEKTFVKASKIARELGYTTDYIGQLCRSGKVNAELVGRSWYVDIESLQAHKRNRYRSNKEVAKREIGSALGRTKKQLRDYAPEIDKKQNFYETHNTTIHTPRYVPDDADLIPSVKKTPVEPEKKQGSLTVELADATAVPVSGTLEETSFTPTEKPEVRFTGKISVFSAEDEEPPSKVSEEPAASEDGAEQVEEPPQITSPESEPTDQPVVRSKAKNKTSVSHIHHAPLPHREAFHDIVPTHEHEKEAADERTDTYPVEVHVEQEAQTTEQVRYGWGRTVALTSTLLVSLTVSAAVLSLESYLRVDMETITSGHRIDVETSFEQIKRYVEPYLG